MPDHPGSGPVLKLKIKDGLQQKGDKWAFFSDEFRSFSYGDTEQEAVNEFYSALQKVINRFESREELKNFLDSRGVYYRFDDGDESGAFRDVEVPLNAP